MSANCELITITILSDAHRFIIAHAEVIRASALHVYHSALAFTPHDTALYKAYSQNATHSVSVLQGVESRWPRNVSTIVGHSRQVNSIAFSPDGLRLASGSGDRILRLWDAMSGVQVAELDGHSDWINSVAFSPDGLHQAPATIPYGYGMPSRVCTLQNWKAIPNRLPPSHFHLTAYA